MLCQATSFVASLCQTSCYIQKKKCNEPIDDLPRFLFGPIAHQSPALIILLRLNCVRLYLAHGLKNIWPRRHRPPHTSPSRIFQDHQETARNRTRPFHQAIRGLQKHPDSSRTFHPFRLYIPSITDLFPSSQQTKIENRFQAISTSNTTAIDRQWRLAASSATTPTTTPTPRHRRTPTPTPTTTNRPPSRNLIALIA